MALESCLFWQKLSNMRPSPSDEQRLWIPSCANLPMPWEERIAVVTCNTGRSHQSSHRKTQAFFWIIHTSWVNLLISIEFMRRILCSPFDNDVERYHPVISSDVLHFIFTTKDKNLLFYTSISARRKGAAVWVSEIKQCLSKQSIE